MKYYYRYLPISDDIRQSGLYVTAAGFTQIPPHSAYPPLHHPDDHDFQWSQGRTLREFQIIYVDRGEGKFESRSVALTDIVPGTMFFLFPGEWHRYSPHSTVGWDEYWVALNGSEVSSLLDRIGVTPENPLISGPLNIDVKNEILRLIDEVRNEDIGFQQVIEARSRVIIAYGAALSTRRVFSRSENAEVISQAKKYLEEHVAEQVNIESLAASLNMGYSLFRKEFRRHTGFAPAQYHLELRINQSVNLLISTTIPLSAICVRVGFASPAYFSRIFKSKLGIPPKQFRDNAQRK